MTLNRPERGLKRHSLKMLELFAMFQGDFIVTWLSEKIEMRIKSTPYAKIYTPGRWPSPPPGTLYNSPAAGVKCLNLVSQSRLRYSLRHRVWSRYTHPGVPIAPVLNQEVETPVKAILHR